MESDIKYCFESCDVEALSSLTESLIMSLDVELRTGERGTEISVWVMLAAM